MNNKSAVAAIFLSVLTILLWFFIPLGFPVPGLVRLGLLLLLPLLTLIFGTMGLFNYKMNKIVQGNSISIISIIIGIAGLIAGIIVYMLTISSG